MQIADQPAVVHVAADTLDGIKGVGGARDVVHGEHDAGEDLHTQHERQDAAESPQVIEVAGRREIDELPMHHACDGQALIQPLLKVRFRLVGRLMCSHGVRVPQPILIFVSDTNS